MVKGLLIFMSFCLAFLASFIAADRLHDRTHAVEIMGAVPMYKTQDSRGNADHIVAWLDRGDAVEVERISYGEGFRAVKIEAIDFGDDGWIFSGDDFRLLYPN